MSYVSGSTLVDGTYYSTNITSGSLNLGTLSSGAIKTITFQAQMNSSLANYQTLTNYAYTYADNVSALNDTASVYTSGSSGSSTWTKKVDNVSSPNGTQTDNTAINGHTLRYTLTYTNNSGTTLNSFQI